MRELVALDMDFGEPYKDALFRLLDEGRAVCPLDPRLPTEFSKNLIEALAPTRILGRDGVEQKLSFGRPVEDGDAVVIATSGSGGNPKGVVLTENALRASAEMTSAALKVTPAKHSWLACIPLSHIGGFSVLLRSYFTSTQCIVLPLFQKDTVNALGREKKATHVSLVRTALDRVTAALFDVILLGGSAPGSNLPENVVTTYGSTETGSGIVYNGMPLDGVDLDFRTTSDGTSELNELLVRSPTLLRDYRDGGLQFVRGSDGTDSWYATGDAGSIDAEGHLVAYGRIEEVIVTGGEKVWPQVVETALCTHPDIEEIAIWKKPDPEWGERVVAWVEMKNGREPISVESLRNYARDALPAWALPKEVVFVHAFLRTQSGKIIRRKLV